MFSPRPPHHISPPLQRTAALAVSCAIALWLLGPGIASAHAHLVQADPAPDSVIAHAPAVASFLFDEPLNPALTRVRITTAGGQSVTTAPGHLAAGHNSELWELPLPQLRDGPYSVFWTSESATDGHVMSSFYTFRVFSYGGADAAGAVTGQAAGTYGGTGGGPRGFLNLGGGATVTALFSWLGLCAQALWLGALVVELAVLAPARRRAETPAAHLAWASARRLWLLVNGALVVAVWALIGEVLSLALQGTAGDWGRAIAPATLGGILSSQNGRFVVWRLVALVVALLLAGRSQAPATAPGAALAPRPPRAGRQALGIAAPSMGRILPWWETIRPFHALLAAGYMLLVAFSGHAADVTPGWLSYPIDWLHLLFTAAWAGGIAALAFGVLPARRLLPVEERAPAALTVLDRFSPVAYVAIGILALSGLYSAVSHVATPTVLTTVAYGQLLIIKLALVGLLMALSATHVYLLRPRLTALARNLTRDARGMGKDRGGHAATIAAAIETGAAVHEGLATLAGRLRLEAGVGAAILLATALMGQTLPPKTVAATAVIPTAITGTATSGDLRGDLTVAPPAVGAATFTLRLWEKNAPLSQNNAAAIIHLYPAGQTALRANLTPAAAGTRFTAHGSIATTGTWHADVLVRTATVNAYRTLPFVFTAGSGAAFAAPGTNPDAVTIAVAPGRISAPNDFTIIGVKAPAVRILSESLDMYMGILPYPAQSLGGGRWRVGNVYAPMNGRWGVTVQVQNGRTWATVRQFVYQVPLSGTMRLLTPQRGAPATSRAAAQGRKLSAAYNVAFASTLPYTALVTEMGSNGVKLMSGGFVRTGLQAHGVDVLDGTPYAYVTNFGAAPGTVTQIDMRTMRVIRTFSVGLGPAHVIFTPDHRRAFVTDFNSSDLFVLDLRSGAARRIAFPGDNCFEPHGTDISEDGRTVYVACAGGAWIYTLDTATEKPGKAVVTGRGTYGVSVNAARHEVWVANQTDNDVTVLDEKTLHTLATIPVGKGPALLVATPNGRKVYVADQLGNAISVIDAARRTVSATIPVAKEPHGPDVTADGKYVYVASIGGNAVTIIRTSDDKVVAVVPAPVGSNEVAIAH